MKVNDIEVIIERVIEETLKKMDRSSNQFKIAISLIRQVGEYPKEIMEAVSGKVNWVRADDSAASALFINSLTLQQLVATANLQVIDYTTSVINQFLLRGKPVWVLACEVDRNELKKHAKFALLKKYDAICEQAFQFGLDCHFSIEKFEHLISCKKKEHRQSSPLPRYLTQNDLIKLVRETDSPEIPAGSRLTPLAEDYAREKNIVMGGKTDAAGKGNWKSMGNP